MLLSRDDFIVVRGKELRIQILPPRKKNTPNVLSLCVERDDR